MTHSDRELIERIALRDEAAFEQLCTNYSEPLRRHLLRIALRHNNRDGLTLEELLAITAESRTILAQLNQEWQGAAVGLRNRYAPSGYGVLARAMHAARPGLTFALAAHMHEIDRLQDINSQLFVGLPPE